MYASSIIGNNIIKLNAVSSTNTYASALLKKQKVQEGLVVFAFYQQNGRGQMGTKWHAEPGHSLTFSVVLMPAFLPVSSQFYLNMAISMGVYSYLHSYIASDVYIKWPNDLLANKKKIGGILIENSIRASQLASSVAGIGINLGFTGNLHLPEATSLLSVTGKVLDPEEELEKICSYLNGYYLRLRAGNRQALKRAYLEKLWGFHQEVEVNTPQGLMMARVTDVNGNGEVVLQSTDKKNKAYRFKEISWRL